MLQKYIEIGRKWMERNVSTDTLQHHGVKGQKWGIRNGPPYPLKDDKKHGIVRKTITGHSGLSKRGDPNSIIDHARDDGTVKARGYYDDDGWKEKEIHTNDHNNPKEHRYGIHGEHMHYYEWDKKTGKPKQIKIDEIPENLRKENDDIL